MAGNLWGADVAQLRQLAQQFGIASEALLKQSTHLSGQINNANAWKGSDATRFKSEWNSSHRMLLMKTASSLKQESKKLLEHASQQEQASNAAHGSGGGPMSTPGDGPGGSGKDGKNLWGPDWLADPDSPFRDGWDIYSLTKAFPNIRAGVYDIAGMLHKSRIADFADPAAWKAFQNSDEFSRFFNTSNQLFEGKWHEALNLTEGSKAFAAFDVLGKGLGGLGVGLDTLDAVNNFREGDYGGAAYSTTKALLGAGSFLPPPAGTVCMVASGALALYDNVPVIRDSVNWVGDKVADGAKAVGGAISDGAKAVGDFFGF